MSEKYDTLLSSVQSLQDENKAYRKRIEMLEEKIEGLERSSHSYRIELRNVPKKDRESKEDLLNILVKTAEIILCIINRMASRRAHKILELVSSSSSLSLQSHEVKPIAETHNATVEDLNNIPSENIENLPPNKNLTDLRSTDGHVQSDDHKKLEISLVSSCDEILSENADDHLHFSQKIDSRLISSRNIENKSCDTDEKRLPTSLVPDYDSDDYNNLECIGVQQDITKKTQPQSSSSSTSTSSSSSSSSSSGTSSDSDDSSSSKTEEEPENRNTVAVMASECCDSDNIQLRPQRCPSSNKSINISPVYTDIIKLRPA
ncbi:unnamed protein product [Parnassius apollo]|uniref:(apollo) hypothetical protein n=1 Tax=Parnassius apollo TaxID=110799 RepID=A0A8S3WLL1_PARAO|nr:unnamed protein product [Parnassius apollo]